jgi:hypothetical protein
LSTTGNLRAVNGTAAAPAYSFVNDPDTGMYYTGTANNLGFSTVGVLRMTINAATDIVSTLPIRVASGTAGAPAFAFSADNDNGMFLATTDTVSLSSGGTARISLSTTQITATLPVRGQNGTAGAPAFSFSGDNDNGMYLPTTNIVGFSAAGVERMRIQTPSTTAGNGAIRVTVPAVTGNRNMEFVNGTATVGVISTTGTATTYGTSSDHRLKTDIQDMNSTEAMNRVMSLKPRDFKWIQTNEKTNGFIAHELQEFFPEAVTGHKDGILEIGNILNEIDEIISENVSKPEHLNDNERWVKTGQLNDYQGIDTSFVIPTLVKVVQDQQNKIESQNSTITLLKNLLVSKGLLSQEELENI